MLVHSTARPAARAPGERRRRRAVRPEEILNLPPEPSSRCTGRPGRPGLPALDHDDVHAIAGEREQARALPAAVLRRQEPELVALRIRRLLDPLDPVDERLEP